MMLVDSSVWIDFFNGNASPEAEFLDECLGVQPVAIGDLMLAEVMQGFRRDKDWKVALELFDSLTILELVGKDIALKSAENFRRFRSQGITVRKTVDCIIATYCIENELALLQADRDFEPFHIHLGLKRAFSS